MTQKAPTRKIDVTRKRKKGKRFEPTSKKED